MKRFIFLNYVWVDLVYKDNKENFEKMMTDGFI